MLGVAVNVAAVLLSINALYVAGAALIGIGFFLVSKYKKSIQEKLDSLKSTAINAQSELEGANSRIGELKKELINRTETFPEITQVRVGYRQSAKQILGKSILLDESGLFPKTTLKTIDLSSAQSDLDSIISKIN